MSMFKYRVYYTAGNGKPCAFTVKSRHVLKSTFTAYCKLHLDVLEKIEELNKREGSAMQRNGGCNGWWDLKFIENLDTGFKVAFVR